jgi:hypothetical protein
MVDNLTVNSLICATISSFVGYLIVPLKLGLENMFADEIRKAEYSSTASSLFVFVI